jgi:hypothetical protein
MSQEVLFIIHRDLSFRIYEGGLVRRRSPKFDFSAIKIHITPKLFFHPKFCKFRTDVLKSELKYKPQESSFLFER